MKWTEIYEVDFRHRQEEEPGYADKSADQQWRARVEHWLAGSYAFHKKPMAYNDEDHTITPETDVEIKGRPWREFPEDLNFSGCYGRFSLSDCKISSWIRFPHYISGWLIIYKCNFSSLKGMPQNVWGGIVISNCRLKSLEGIQKEIKGDFDCRHNDLTNLMGGPAEVEGNYYCGGNQLGTLKGIARKIGGDILIEHEYHLHSLVGIADMIDEVGYTTDRGCTFSAPDTTIKKGGLGLVAIKGMKDAIFWPREVANIIQKHLGNTDNVFECQQELIDAGYPEHAVL